MSKAKDAKAPPGEMVSVRKQTVEALWMAVAVGIGLDEVTAKMGLEEILAGKDQRKMGQDVADKLVLCAHKRSGGDFASAVGFIFNDPKLVGHGRHGGGHTFAQVAKSVVG